MLIYHQYAEEIATNFMCFHSEECSCGYSQYGHHNLGSEKDKLHDQEYQR